MNESQWEQLKKRGVRFLCYSCGWESVDSSVCGHCNSAELKQCGLIMTAIVLEPLTKES